MPQRAVPPRLSYPPNGTLDLGGEPWGIAYDPSSDNMFVVNLGLEEVDIISASSYATVKTVPVGEAPFGAAFDSDISQVWITNADSNNVSVISDDTDRVSHTTGVGTEPLGIAFEPGTGYMYVANFGSNNVSVIYDGSGRVVASVPTGFEPEGVVYDPVADEMLVTNYGSNNLTVISAETNIVVGSISVGAEPTAIAYDPANEELFVTDDGSDNLTIINAVTNIVVGSVPTGLDPEGIVYEPHFGELYVANLGDDNVSVVQGATGLDVGSIPTGGGPAFLAYDASTQQIWVTAAGVGNVTILNDTSPSVQVQLWNNSFWGGGSCTGTGVPAPSSRPTTTEYFLDPASPGSAWTPFPNATQFSATFAATLEVPTSGYYGFQMASYGGSVLYIDGHLALSTFEGTCSSGGNVSANVGLGAGAHQLRVYYYWSASFNAFLTLQWRPPGVGSYEQIPPASFGPPAGVPLTVGSSPGTPLYADGQIFVPDAGSSSVTVVNGAIQAVVANLSVGSDPQTPTYVPASQLVFVPNFGSNTVSLIDAPSDLVVGLLIVGSGPETGLYDPATGNVYVPNAGSGTVSVLLGFGTGVAATVVVGSDPQTPALDPTSDVLYVPNNGSDTVSAVDAASNVVLATIAVGSEPGPPAYDPATQEVFVPNYGSGNVSVISATSNTVVATIDVGSAPFGPAAAGPPHTFSRTTKPSGAPLVDPSTGEVYVTDGNSDNVSVLDPLTNRVLLSIGVGTEPGAPVLDGGNGNIYVANNGSGNLSVISSLSNEVVASVATGGDPAPPVVDNATGTLYVPNTADATLTVVPGSYYLTFTETGLPSGATWKVVVSTASGSTTEIFSRTTAPVSLANGSVQYAIFGPAGYVVAGPVAPAGTVTIDGADVAEQVTFVAGHTRAVAFHEAGLPKGTGWCVRLGVVACGTGTTISFANITPYHYAYALVPLPGFVEQVGKGGRQYSPPPNGTVNVTTHTASVKVTFKVATYALEFNETGLASGKSWTVKVNWTEDGKPHRQTLHSRHTMIVVDAPNGTVTFTVEAVKGYAGGGTTSTVTVDGAPVYLTVTYTET